MIADAVAAADLQEAFLRHRDDPAAASRVASEMGGGDGGRGAAR